jgi:poly(A) polymerase
VIKFEFDGIAIDLVFARLVLTTIPEDLDLLDHNILKTLEEKCVVSLNGSRTTDEILRLVPSIATFHMALRCIKLWAKRRGLYNNAMGYIAGVACALLTARICQLYPNSSAATIVMRFFKIYQQWKWPQPVILKPIEDYPLHLRVWNPRLVQADRYHRMPVITPAYPSMCSTHNVSKSTMEVMKEEFKRGSEVMLRIEQRKATWADLFTKSDFFHRHKHFFQVVAVATSEESHRAWAGFVESRIRQLVLRLETEEFIAGAPPFPETYEVVVHGTTDEEILKAHFYSEEDGSVAKQEAQPEDGVAAGPLTYTTCLYVALAVAPPDPAHKGPRRLILDRPVNEFNYITNTWDKKTGDMRLLIRDIRRDNLPGYLFTETPRPPKGKRAKKTMSPPPSDEDIGKRSRTSLDEPATPLAEHESPFASSTEIQDLAALPTVPASALRR